MILLKVLLFLKKNLMFHSHPHPHPNPHPSRERGKDEYVMQ